MYEKVQMCARGNGESNDFSWIFMYKLRCFYAVEK